MDILERIDEVVSEAKWSFDIDFPTHAMSAGGRVDLKKGLEFDKETKTYKALDKVSTNEDEWTKYLDDMAKSGISVEYDNLKDVYKVKLTK